jgi:tetratricopeptide repeat protein
MDEFTLVEYAIKVAIEVGRKIKTLNTTEVDSGITEAYNRALNDWSQHAPTSRDELRLNAALDGYLKNATSYEVLDQDTKDFIDRFKKRLSEQPAAHNYLMMLRADEQANSEERNLQEHRKTQESILGLKDRMEELNMAPQYVRALLKELPLEQGLERTESTLEEMLTNGRIHSEGAKCLIAEFVRFLFEHTDKITEEATRLRVAGDSYLAETLEEIKKVLTGESEQSLTAIYEKFKEQERQNEVKALEELIEAAQIQFSFGEAREFYERLIKLAPTIEHYLNYAYLLQSLNDFKGARDLNENILQELQELVKKKPEAYKPIEAMVLNNLGILLRNTNQFKQAKAYCEEALETYRMFAKKKPEVYKPIVAKALHNLGNLYIKTNELKLAQTYHIEALEIYRELAKMKPNVYKSDLVRSLNSLGVLLKSSNEPKLAYSYYMQALQISRELAEENPEAYIPDVAITLVNLGNLLNKVGEVKQARTYYEEALQIRRELAKKNPEAYVPAVAKALNNLGALLRGLKEFKQAKACFEEALQIRRKLAEKNPEAYMPDVAMTLINLGNLLNNTNEFKLAQEHYEDALRIYRELAEENPQAYLSEVAKALHNLTILYMALEQAGDAEEAYHGAHSIYKKLAHDHPRVYAIDYAEILIIGFALVRKPKAYLEEAKAILSKYPEHPEAQGLLSFIEGLSKREQ